MGGIIEGLWVDPWFVYTGMAAADDGLLFVDVGGLPQSTLAYAALLWGCELRLLRTGPTGAAYLILNLYHMFLRLSLCLLGCRCLKRTGQPLNLLIYYVS